MKRTIPALALLASLAAAPAGLGAAGWLTGPSLYQEAVQALAAGRILKARSLLEQADPGSARVEWVQELVGALREAKLPDASPAARAFAHHNVYLFLRTEEEVPPELAEDWFHRALGVYTEELPREGPVSLDLRWGHAGLLHEAGRGREAEEFLLATRGRSTHGWGPEGPPRAQVSRLPVGINMLLAYYFTSRGDFGTACDLLEEAWRDAPGRVRAWAIRSDDFASMRDFPRYRDLFGESGSRRVR